MDWVAEVAKWDRPVIKCRVRAMQFRRDVPGKGNASIKEGFDTKSCERAMIVFTFCKVLSVKN